MGRSTDEPTGESRTSDVVEVAVIGAGQAGLAMGYFLRRQGPRFVILERADSIGAAWRERWESLTLFTPRRYSALPGLPFVYYGEEIGMGEDLQAQGRMAVRTPMQWEPTRNGGFSTAASRRLIQRLVPDGYSPQHVNVADQKRDPDSLWSFMRKLISIRRTCPELGWGTWAVVDQPSAQVLVQRCQLDGSAVVTVHNLGADPVTVDVPIDSRDEGLEAVDLMAEEVVTGGATTRVALEGYGFRWLRVRAAGDLAIP